MLRVLTVLLSLSLFAVTRRRRRRSLPARAVIVSPRESTVIARDGAVRSVQSAELTVSHADLEQLWSPANLENLARTYWRFLSRVTLGLIRIIYRPHERSVALLIRPLTLLRFAPPDYRMDAKSGSVRWHIKDGLLVARSGRGSGFLAIDILKLGPAPEDAGADKVRIDIEVANFYPSIAAGFGTFVYEVTQSAVHLLVTHAFLRSLARLDLARSKVGRLAADGPETVTPGTAGVVADSESVAAATAESAA
jgi:hypothetical protein